MHAAYFTDFYISQYLFVIIFFQIYTKVDVLFLYFESLNDKLRNMGLNNQSHITDLSEALTEFKKEQIKTICKIHIKLCKLIHMHNNAHGWQIVIIFVLVFSTVLNALYPCLAEQIKMRYGAVENEAVFNVRGVTCIIFYCFLISALGAKCSATRKQAFKTGLIANDILMDLSAENNSSAEAYKDQLRMIIDQIAYRNPHFSAGGVFSVDYTTVSCLATTIVTYITTKTAFPSSICDAVKPLYHVSRIMCIWPYKYKNNNQVVPLTLINKGVALIMIIGLTSLFVWSLQTIWIKQDQERVTLLVVTFIFNVFLHLNTIYSVIIENSKSDKFTKSFYLELDAITKQHAVFDSTIFPNIHRKCSRFLILFFTSNVVLSILDIIYTYALGYISVTGYLSIYISQFYFVIACIQLITQIEALQQHFAFLNKKLENYNQETKENIWNPVKIKTLSYIHERLCDIIDEFNDNRGLQIAIQICTVSSLVINDLYNHVIRLRDNIEVANMVLHIMSNFNEAIYIVLYCVSKTS
ncbi:hypothetical protein ILUMI_13225 [Ignelater luminosus]|uniref:Gustatory receptor n=1 Tax=Ignelater luminosus TaxID=2038154 RepID=A0A8K0G612_IGNLU|nr:hypothetical protein ILUMI_13225 [Ignelater luminosus]